MIVCFSAQPTLFMAKSAINSRGYRFNVGWGEVIFTVPRREKNHFKMISKNWLLKKKKFFKYLLPKVLGENVYIVMGCSGFGMI